MILIIVMALGEAGQFYPMRHCISNKYMVVVQLLGDISNIYNQRFVIVIGRVESIVLYNMYPEEEKAISISRDATHFI